MQLQIHAPVLPRIVPPPVEITISEAMRARLARERAVFGVSRRAVLLAVCAEFEIDVAKVTGSRRLMALMPARRAFAVLAKRRLNLSLPQIGRWLGGRDHTTALYALRMGLAREAIDPDYAARLARIDAQLWPAEGAA